MKRTAILSVMAAGAFLGSTFCAPAANAVTQHCDSALYPTKVELDGSATSVDTGLAPGTEVCIKAGNGTVIVTVDADGFITQNGISNKNGNAYLGISYYAYGEEATCVDDPYTYEDECNPGGGGS